MPPETPARILTTSQKMQREFNQHLGRAQQKWQDAVGGTVEKSDGIAHGYAYREAPRVGKTGGISFHQPIPLYRQRGMLDDHAPMKKRPIRTMNHEQPR